MFRLFPPLILLSGLTALAGCTNVLTGEAGFTAGRTTIVPCHEKPGALLVVEALDECWTSTSGERFTCSQWRQIVSENATFCSDEIVYDSPSTNTLTGFFAPPLDQDNMLGSATIKLYDLPCNPDGPTASDYPNFAEMLSVYTGDARIVKDDGDTRAQVEFEMYRTDLETGDPLLDQLALSGKVTAGVCR